MQAQSIAIYPPSPTPPSLRLTKPPTSNSSNSIAEYIPPTDSDSYALATSPDFLWTEQRLRAVELIADGRYTDKEIAQIVGTTIPALNKWKAHPTFYTRLETTLAEYAEKVLSTGIAIKTNRIRHLNHRHQLLSRVINERSQVTQEDSPFYSPLLSEIPGMSTGLINVERKSLKTDHGYEVIIEAKVDTALLNEIRKTEEQAARETGQWAETHNVNVLQKTYIGIDISQV